MKSLLLIFLLAFSVGINAQDKQKDDKIPGIPAISLPEAYSMAKYTEFPAVDNYGAVPITLPIYTINSGDLAHKIDLNYCNSGIKVADEATWVGLGWNVNVGGAIIRSVRDLADDVNVIGNESNVPTDYGWFAKPDRIQNCNTGEDLNNLVNHFRNLHFDLEPDIYYVHVGELNFKFIFGFDGKPKLIDCDKKVKLKFTNTTGSIEINEFELIDDCGTTYTFGGNFKEITTVTQKFYPTVFLSTLGMFDLNSIVNYYSTPIDVKKKFTTSWFLSSIKSANGNIISFDYVQKNGVLMDIVVNKFQTNNPTNNTPVLGNTLNSVKSVGHSTNTWYLKDILFNGGKMHFNISDREDLRNAKKLDKIQLFDASNNSIHTYDFKYHYMNTNATYLEKRLILESIIHDNSDVFSFGYNLGNLPAKNSPKQDFWGYFSNKSTSLIPTIYVYPDALPEDQYRCYPVSSYSNVFTIAGSDRTVDNTTILTGTLKDITYPTGGITEYNFESNVFFDALSNQNILGGGIRIASIIKKPIQGQNIVKNYTYDLANGNSSGMLIDKLAFATPTNYSFSGNSPYGLYKWESATMSAQDKYNWFTLRCANNYFPLANLDGYQIGYTRVIVTETGNGKIEKLYYPPKNQSNNASVVNTSPVDAVNFASDPGSPVFEFTGQKTWTKRCNESYGGQTKTYYIEYVSSQSRITQNCSSCNSLDNADLTVYSNIKYLGGGGYFTPSQYSSANFPLYDEYAFGLTDFNFKVIRVSDFMKNYYCESRFGFSDEALSYIQWDNIVWGGIPQTGTNIFPYPPLSDKLNDPLVYSRLQYEKKYREGDTEPTETTEYEYKIYPANTEERVFGILCLPHNVVSVGLRATPQDALQHIGNTKRGNAYFISSFYGNYAVPNAWSKYYYNVNTYALISKITKTEQESNGTISINKSFLYNNNLLTSKISEINSDGKVHESQFKYPTDYVYTGINSIYSKMLNKNMLNYPIEELKFVDGKIVFSKLLTYKDVSGLYLPEILYKSKLTTPLTPPTEGLSSASSNTSQAMIISNKYDPNIYFDIYNPAGRLQQYHNSSNLYTTLIWGYKNQYPIAEIKNATYDKVEPLLGGSVEVNNMSIANTPDMSKINNLRTNLNDAFVSIYNYKPLVGITTKTDPRGVVTTYKYDGFNRLKNIKDANGYTIQQYEYHFSTQNK